MFKKPHDVGLSKKHTLGGKDVKKFRLDVFKKYPTLSDEQWHELFPDKVVEFLKLHSGALVYKNADNNPIFFDPSGHLDLLIPTIYALCVVPDMIPSVITNSFVSETMLRGADLFLQGMAGKGFLKDQICSVTIPGNPVPFAVGKMALSYTKAQENNMEGRGLISLHYYGDHLYGLGDGRPPNEGFCDGRVSACTLSEEPAETDVDEAINVPSEQCRDLQQEKTNDERDWNHIIMSCAVGGLKSIKKTELPMPLSEFYSSKMMPLKPHGIASLDMKKSKWKRVPKLLEDMEDQGLVVLKNVRKEMCIFDVDKTHPAIDAWKPDIEIGTNAGGGHDVVGVREIKYLFKPPQIFSETLGLEKAQLIHPEMIDMKLREYIMGYGGMSVDSHVASVDHFLASALYGKKEQPEIGSKIPFREIQTRLYAKLQKWHCIEKVDKDGTKHQIINKGEPSNICLTALKRSGRIYTTITGMEMYGYDPKTLSDTLQKRMKTACFVADLPGKSGRKEVVMQGDWISKRGGSHYLPSYFEDEGMPSSCVTILNNPRKK